MIFADPQNIHFEPFAAKWFLCISFRFLSLFHPPFPFFLCFTKIRYLLDHLSLWLAILHHYPALIEDTSFNTEETTTLQNRLSSPPLQLNPLDLVHPSGSGKYEKLDNRALLFLSEDELNYTLTFVSPTFLNCGSLLLNVYPGCSETHISILSIDKTLKGKLGVRSLKWNWLKRTGSTIFALARWAMVDKKARATRVLTPRNISKSRSNSPDTTSKRRRPRSNGTK